MSDGGMSDARLATIRLLCELDKNLQGSTVVDRAQLRALIARLDAAERERDRLYSLAKANNDLVRMMTTERRVLREALEGCLHFDDGFIRSGVIGDALKQWRWAAEAALTANHSAPVVEE